MRKRHGGLFVNLILACTICALYFGTSGTDALPTMAGMLSAPIYRGSEKGKIAVLCAVSWDAAAVDDILNILSDKDICISFAVSGKWARGNQKTLIKMAEAGHEIITMGDNPIKDGSLSEVEADVFDSLFSIKEICGVAPTKYYSGERNITVSARAAKKLSLTHILCTIDLNCANGESHDIVERGLKSPIEGSIILIEPTAQVSQGLAGLLDGFIEKGLAPVRVDDVLGKQK